MAPAIKVGQYILKKKIGEGAFAEVRHAVHASTGEEFAVKVFDRAALPRSDLERDVKREIKIMQYLRHPGIVSVHAALVTETKMYLVMELVRGGELYDEIVTKQRLEEVISRRYFQQLVDAIVYCHKRGVVHRDLKPENILLTDDGKVKITDFGMSWMKENVDSERRTKQMLKTQCGTPKYMAPEIIVRSGKGYDGEKLDAWDCGMVLYALLAGYLPFNGDDDNAVFQSILRGKLKFPSHFSSGVRDVLSRLLEKDPNKRASLHEIQQHEWFQVDYAGDVSIQDSKVPVVACGRAGSSVASNNSSMNQDSKQDVNSHKRIGEACRNTGEKMKLGQSFKSGRKSRGRLSQHIREGALKVETTISQGVSSCGDIDRQSGDLDGPGFAIVASSGRKKSMRLVCPVHDDADEKMPMEEIIADDDPYNGASCSPTEVPAHIQGTEKDLGQMNSQPITKNISRGGEHENIVPHSSCSPSRIHASSNPVPPLPYVGTPVGTREMTRVSPHYKLDDDGRIEYKLGTVSLNKSTPWTDIPPSSPCTPATITVENGSLHSGRRTARRVPSLGVFFGSSGTVDVGDDGGDDTGGSSVRGKLRSPLTTIRTMLSTNADGPGASGSHAPVLPPTAGSPSGSGACIGNELTAQSSWFTPGLETPVGNPLDRMVSDEEGDSRLAPSPRVRRRQKAGWR